MGINKEIKREYFQNVMLEYPAGTVLFQKTKGKMIAESKNLINVGNNELNKQLNWSFNKDNANDAILIVNTINDLMAHPRQSDVFLYLDTCTGVMYCKSYKGNVNIKRVRTHCTYEEY